MNAIRNFLVLGLIVACVPAMQAAPASLEDAIRASNIKEVMEFVGWSNSTSSVRKAHLVALAKTITAQREKEARTPVNLEDAFVISKGAIASIIACASIREVISDIIFIRNERTRGIGNNMAAAAAEGLMRLAKMSSLSLAGILSTGLGIYWIRKGSRCEHGKKLYAQAQQIEKQINQLKVRAN